MPILEVTLKTSMESPGVGRPIPIEIEVRNTSDRPLWIVGAIDGSEQAIRYPHYLPLITLGGRTVGKPPPPEDPLVSPLRIIDFRRLQPGESFDPTTPERGAAYLPLSTFLNFQPAEPGRYQFSLSLSTESEEPQQWLGRFGQDAERAAVLERITEVPRLTVRSNLLEVHVG